MQRNFHYDLMRLAGLLVIMIAHAHPPDWLFQLRNFGTPLLIIGSGLTYAYIYHSRVFNTTQFLRRRIPRLVIPPWLFMLAFFPVSYLIFKLSGAAYPFNAAVIVKSFLFTDGMPFIWIFKIYVFLAVLTPLALLINQRVSSTFQLVVTLTTLLAVYEFAVWRIIEETSEHDTLLHALLPLIPYGLVYCYAFRMGSLTSKQLMTALFVSGSVALLCFLALYLSGSNPLDTQSYKYPPRLYYLSYALFATHLIFLGLRHIKINKSRQQRLVVWISSNSLWIYLWHIPATYLVEFTISEYGFIARFSVIITMGTILTVMQNWAVSQLTLSNKTLRWVAGYLAPTSHTAQNVRKNTG